MTKFAIIENAKRQARLCFVGLAIRNQPSLAEGVYGPIRSEKILKFNRKALASIGKRKVEKADPRYMGGEDTMRFPVGKPGTRERLDALADQYAIMEEEETSPFGVE